MHTLCELFVIFELKILTDNNLLATKYVLCSSYVDIRALKLVKLTLTLKQKQQFRQAEYPVSRLLQVTYCNLLLVITLDMTPFNYRFLGHQDQDAYLRVLIDNKTVYTLIFFFYLKSFDNGIWFFSQRNFVLGFTKITSSKL